MPLYSHFLFFSQQLLSNPKRSGLLRLVVLLEGLRFPLLLSVLT